MNSLFDIDLKNTHPTNKGINKKDKTSVSVKSEQTKNDQKDSIKKVIVATPSLDGKVDVWYADSLAKSISLCQKNNIDVQPVFIAAESILHMARNLYIKIAYDKEVDSLIFIDGDQRWEHEYFLKVVQSDKDVFALPVCLKNDIPKFNFKTFKDTETVKVNKGTYEFTVPKVGTGFIKLSKKVIKDLWDSNDTVLFKGDYVKMIFDFSYSGDEYVGEDYTLCKKLRELGYDIWIDASTTCQHIGPKKYDHDYLRYRKVK